MSERSVKTALMSSIHRLMETRSIDQIRVEDILSLCGVSRTTFYRYFKDKYDLMNYCYRAEVNEIVSRYDIQDYLGTIQAIFRYVERNRDFLRTAVQYEGQNSFMEFFQEYLEKYYTSVVCALSGQQQLTCLQRIMISHHCAGWVYSEVKYLQSNNDHEELVSATDYVQAITPIIIDSIIALKDQQI